MSRQERIAQREVRKKIVANYGTIRDISTPFTTVLSNGENGVGLRIDRKDYKLTKPEARVLARQISVISNA